MNEKVYDIALALAKRYGIAKPEFSSVKECQIWINSVLNRESKQSKKCPHCQNTMSRKLVKVKLRYVCRSCKKIFALRG